MPSDESVEGLLDNFVCALRHHLKKAQSSTIQCVWCLQWNLDGVALLITDPQN